jgi:hypothetical protein
VGLWEGEFLSIAFKVFAQLWDWWCGFCLKADLMNYQLSALKPCLSIALQLLDSSITFASWFPVFSVFPATFELHLRFFG